MASTSLSCAITGCRMPAVQCQNVWYDNVKLSVMSKLCVDILLGHNFLGPHEKVEILVGCTLLLCGLKAAKVQSPSVVWPLVAWLQAHCHQVVQLFWRGWTLRRFQNSQWLERRCRWTVNMNIAHKKWMVVDFSQTVGRFAYPDAYPLPWIDEVVQAVSHYAISSTRFEGFVTWLP